jgi:hypothetical protein
MSMDKNNRTYRFQPWLLMITLVVLLSMPLSAMAYLDPTTGSMLISAIVGLLASLVLAIKTYWYRIKAFFKRKPAETDADDGAS